MLSETSEEEMGGKGFSFPKDLLFFDIPLWFIASLIALLLIHKKMRIGNEDKKEKLRTNPYSYLLAVDRQA